MAALASSEAAASTAAAATATCTDMRPEAIRVVHQVHRARRRAEEGEGGKLPQHRGGVEEPPAEHQPGEDEHVLRPLPRPQRLDQRAR